MNLWLLAASLASLVTAAIHAVVGGPQVAAPLAASDLGRVPRFTALYVWHMVTVLLLGMTGAFAAAAWSVAARPAAAFAAALAAAFALLSVGLGLRVRATARELPQWTLFTLIVGLAAPGLVP